MKSFSSSKAQIEHLIRQSKDLVLMLDFDGTLSPIAPTPQKASLPRSTRHLLTQCAGHFPTVVISGRSLIDIQNKLRDPSIIVAGSHGLEWSIHGHVSRHEIPSSSLHALRSAKTEFLKLKPEYPGILIEDKFISLAIHYRLVDPRIQTRFRHLALSRLSPLIDHGIELIQGKKVIEAIPKIDWNKGHFAKLILNLLQKDPKSRALPIYLGDDTTDEDVFQAIRNAITIRIGYSAKSHARFFLKNQAQVDLFLEWLLSRA